MIVRVQHRVLQVRSLKTGVVSAVPLNAVKFAVDTADEADEAYAAASRLRRVIDAHVRAVVADFECGLLSGGLPEQRRAKSTQ